MFPLFLRTASQGVQAFVPIAFGLAALRRIGRADGVASVYAGVCIALVASVQAGTFLQQTTRQSLLEATLAATALAAAMWAARAFRGNGSPSRAALIAVTILLVIRQTMEIEAVLAAAAHLRSQGALIAIGSATLLALGLAGAWTALAPRLNERANWAATRTFVVLFASLLGLYAFHESAEARILPWSDVLHAATEPYGPDGLYGQHFAWLLIAGPLAAAAATLSSHFAARRIAAAIGLAVVAIAGSLSLRSAGDRGATPAGPAVVLANAPHVLFRHTGIDNAYNTLSISSLADPAGPRSSTGLSCERVAFSMGRGLCLQADRGLFTTYRAVLFDTQFNRVASWTLAGSPSRTRVAADGRVGAITVFVTGHGYGASPFSTKTTLVDMASGDPLGDLEQFGTWRDGKRMTAQDFNFWGVTFGGDSNTFYATLGTGGHTYLVKGDLGLRKLVVLHDGVECPSVSPDGRTVAFKKRVGAAAGSWRIAVLNLETQTERLVTNETRFIDDQIEWLDNTRVLYAIPRPDSAVADVWMAAIDGALPSSIYIPRADSPAIVRTVSGPH